MKYIFTLLVFLIILMPLHALPSWKIYSEQNQWSKENNYYSDILNRLRNQPKYYGDRNTDAHEASHHIHAQIRNYYFQLNNKHYYNAVYCGSGKYLLLREPTFTIKDVTTYVPELFRNGRYVHYLVDQQQSWNDRPLYILDEWVAYNNGNIVSLEDALANIFPPQLTNTMESSLEFVIYGICLMQAMEDLDKSYLTTEKDFVEFMKWNIEKSFEIYKKSQEYKIYVWDKDHKLLEDLTKNKEAEPLRKFCLNKLNIDLTKWKL